MIFIKRLKILFLVLGDVVLFYASLYLALTLRYQSPVEKWIWGLHQNIFFYIHLLWLAFFYIGGMYDMKNFSSIKKLFERVLKTMAAATVAAVIIFYLASNFAVGPKPITPKTNLFIDVVLVTVLLILWRRLFWRVTINVSKIKILFFGNSKEARDLAQSLKNNPYLGYEPINILAEIDHNLSELIKKYKIQLVVAAKNVLSDKNAAKQFYEILPLGVTVVNFENFYESLTEKIPVYLINETWFLENLMEINKRLFEYFKRVFDIVLAIILTIPVLILFPIIAALSKIESRDKIFVRQPRVGKNGKVFTLYKFRNMYHAAEIDGKARWTEENDPRITKVGGFLRKTRLDELPQIINVLKGEMSFIGPRPERPEFVDELQKQIPHYAMRHLIKPGLTGWAQTKFPYGASVEDAMEKLQYDLYYIKNRSFVLDLAIAAKTIITILSCKER